LAPSESAKRPRWFGQTLRDAQEHVEAPKITFRESRPSQKFLTYMALMTNIIDSELSHLTRPLWAKCSYPWCHCDDTLRYVSDTTSTRVKR
jgi:hypothetical protein